MEYHILVDEELEKEVEIIVAAGELENTIDRETERLRRKLVLKGFRKGKVPKTLIKSRYRDSIRSQSQNELITRFYLKVLEEKGWRPASSPKLLNLEEGEQVRFRLRFEVIPEFDVANYRDLELFKSEPAPDKFLLEQGVNEIRERYATIREVSRPSVVDDLITMDIETKNGNRPGERQNDVRVRIGDRSLPDEINRALVGKRKSDRDEIKADDAIYRINIKKVEEKNLPDLDDNFAKSLGYENITLFEKKLMDDLKKIEEQRIEEELKESLSRVVLERIRFNVPKSLIQNEYEKILERSQLPDSEANKERFWSVAEKRVRFNLILDKIADKEGIKVDEKDVLDVVSKIGIKLNDENRIDVFSYVSNILNREKTIDFLLKNSRIAEKNRIITPKEARNDTHSVRH